MRDRSQPGLQGPIVRWGPQVRMAAEARNPARVVGNSCRSTWARPPDRAIYEWTRPLAGHVH